MISPDEMNGALRTVSVAPMTTGSRPAEFRIAVSLGGKRGLILLDKIRTLDRVRLIQRSGRVSAGTLRATLERLQETFAP